MGIIGRIISAISSGPAIQNLERIDMKIELRDGGVLLPIVVSQHLDDSEEIEALIRAKLKTYAAFIDSGELGNPKYIKIQFKCVKKPDVAAIRVIDEFVEYFHQRRAELSWTS